MELDLLLLYLLDAGLWLKDTADLLRAGIFFKSFVRLFGYLDFHISVFLGCFSFYMPWRHPNGSTDQILNVNALRINIHELDLSIFLKSKNLNRDFTK